MTRVIVRAIIGAAVGALLCGILLLGGFGRRTVGFDLERDTPSAMTGVYPTERDGRHPFVWTQGQSDFHVPGLDRHVSWSCAARFRGARPDAFPAQPDVAVLVDGVTVSVTRATNDYQTVNVTVPPLNSGRGLALGLLVTPTFQPSKDDPRQLGVQLDRLACEPAGRVTPPQSTTVAVGLTGAALGAMIGLSGATMIVAALAMMLASAGIALAFTLGLASYGAYPSVVAQLALWIAVIFGLGQKLIEAARRKPILLGASNALVATALVLFFNLLGLLHPSKNLVDVVFHAHRLGWVLAGRYFFTQPLGNGVAFPYAIGLYVFAAPWTALTHNHAALLRVVVCAMNAIAGLMVYRMVIRSWADERAAAVAALLFGLAPIWFAVVGNANLTNAFGQSVGVIALAGAATLPLDWRRVASWAGLVLVVALGFLSHVTTISLLSATLAVAALLFWWRGGPALRTPAIIVLGVTLVTAVIAVALYYDNAQFIPVYKGLAHVQAPAGQQTSPVSARAIDFVRQFIDGIGWPVVLLAAVGGWRLWVERVRDRLALVIVASLVVWLGFSMQNLLTPVDVRLERYAAEFLGRINHATYPVLAILAARGASWSWGLGRNGRRVAMLLVLAAFAVGARAWLAWIQ